MLLQMLLLLLLLMLMMLMLLLMLLVMMMKLLMLQGLATVASYLNTGVINGWAVILTAL